MRIFLAIFILTLSCAFAEDGGIYIIRHGQADHNVSRTYNSTISQGIVSHLTEAGKKEAQETAHALLKKGLNPNNIDTVFVSPLPRTKETADEMIKAGLFTKEEVVIEPRLRETEFGELEGKPILKKWEASFSEKYGTESDEEISCRVDAFYKDLKAKKWSGNVIVITHKIQGEKLIKQFSGMDEKLSNAEFAGPFKL